MVWQWRWLVLFGVENKNDEKRSYEVLASVECWPCPTTSGPPVRTAGDGKLESAAANPDFGCANGPGPGRYLVVVMHPFPHPTALKHAAFVLFSG